MDKEQKIGEIKIRIESLIRGTTKPLIEEIEILYPNKFNTPRRYVGLPDTGADITMVDDDLVKKLHLVQIGENIYKLDIKIPSLFDHETLHLEIQPFNFKNFSQVDKPDILLGRDFLSRCKMSYDGLNNIVTIESFAV